MREERVVALDRHHRLPRLDRVAVVEGVDGQRVPVVRAELEDRDRLVHPAQPGVPLLEDLHQHPRPAAVGEQGLARVVEVGVGVVARRHLLDRERERLRREPRPRLSGAAVALLLGQAGVERGLRDLELRVARLRRRDPRLELVPGSRERAGERAVRRSASSSRRARPTPPRADRGGARAGPRSCSGRARGERVADAPSSRAAAPRGASRSARAPSGGARRARTSRSRRARRRGRRRARRRAARRARARTRGARWPARGRAAAARRFVRTARTATVLAAIIPITAGARRAASPRAARASPAGGRRTRRASFSGPRRSGFLTSGAEDPLLRRGDLDRPVGEPDGAAPGGRAVDEHAVRERHPAQSDLVAGPSARGYRLRVAYRNPSARRRPRAVRPAAPERRRRAGSASRPRSATGRISRTDDEVNASSAASSSASRYVPSSTS